MVLALFGNPVRHSLSPAMHNAALAAMGINGVYVPFCVTDLRAAVLGMRGMGIRGASVTLPFKVEVMELLDELDDDARRIGAVNTISCRRGALRGTNTDWIGLWAALGPARAGGAQTYVIVGAGGAARAALFAVLQDGGQPVLVNRTAATGGQLAAEWGCSFRKLADLDRLEADCLINTTAVGMAPHGEESPVPAAVLPRFRWVMDCVYTPLETRLLREARAAGCEVLSGLEMFVTQGAEQLRLWTGREPPTALMRQVVQERLAAPSRRSITPGGER